jgi:2-haloacid dehalogenase
VNSVDDKLLKGMKITLAFDVYGTLVDPSGMAKHLAHDLGAAFRLFAFSNGKRCEIDAVLSNANIVDCFEGIVTADDVRSFKPDPAVYSYARRATRAWSSPFWLVSSNPWDIIGARSAGLSSAWVQRSEEKIYDPWNIEPNVTVRSLVDLPAALGR